MQPPDLKPLETLEDPVTPEDYTPAVDPESQRSFRRMRRAYRSHKKFLVVLLALAAVLLSYGGWATVSEWRNSSKDNGAVPQKTVVIIPAKGQVLTINSQLQVSNSGTIKGNLTVLQNGTFSGTVTANNIVGNGNGITDLNASNLNGGKISDNLLSSNVALKNANNTFTGNNTFTNPLALQATLNGTSGIFSTNVSALSFTQNGHVVCDDSGNCGSNMTLNGISGAVQLQGTAHQVTVTTSGDTVTISLPQDIDTSSSPTFAGETVNGTVSLANGSTLYDDAFNGLTFQVDGRTYTFPTTGSNSQVICTTAVTCASGGGQAVLLAPGSAQTNTSDTSAIFVNNTAGGDLIELQGGGVDKFVVDSNGNVVAAGTITATSFTGDGSGLTNVNAAELNGQAGSYYQNAGNINSGTLSDSRLNTDVTTQGNLFNGNSELVQLTASGLLPALNGSNLTSVNAAELQGYAASYFTDAGNISSGTLSDSRLSSNVALLNAENTFTGTTNTFNGIAAGNITQNGNQVCDSSGNCAGVGGGVTTSGTTTSGYIPVFNGSSTITNSIITQASSTVTVAGTLAANFLQGDGSGLTNLNADNISSGTLAVANGGTGTTGGSFTADGIIYYASGELQSTAAGATGDCLVAQTSGAPEWESCSSASSGGAAGGDLSGTYPNPKVVGINGSPVTESGLASGDFLVYNGTDWVNASISGDLTVSANGVATIADGAVTNAKLANSSLSVNAGAGLNGGGSVALGGSTSLSVVYGSAANTAVQGNVTLACPTAAVGGNISVTGGGTITLGTGGNCGSINTVASPSFTSITLSTPLAVSSGGTGANTASGARTNLGAAASGANTDITSLGGLSTALPVNEGGTGATSASGARSNLGAAASGSNSDITSLTGVTSIDNGAAGLSVGNTGQTLTLQGNASTVLTATDSGFTTTVGFVAPTANVTYLFQPAAGGTYDICTTAGNCASSGGGVTTSGGTTDYIALFTGSQTIGNSVLSESGSAITDSGTLAIQGSGSLTLGTPGPSGTTGSVTFDNSSNAHTLTLQAGATSGDLIFTLPTTAGSSGQCLTTDGSGNLGFSDCLSGGSGGSGGVASLNNLSGSLTLNNATGSGSNITINNAKADGSTEGIATFNASEFSDNGAGVISLATTGVTANPYGSADHVTTFTVNAEGQLTAANSVPIAINANQITSGTIASTLISGNYTGITGTGTLNGLTVSGSANLQGNATVGSGSANGSLNFLDGTNDGYTGSIQLSGALGADEIYTLPITGGTICLDTGNCAGTGGGVTTTGGTTDYIAMFTGSQSIADSILSQAGTTVTVAGTLSATALQGDGSGVTNLNATQVTSGTLAVAYGGTGTGSFTTNGVVYGNGTSLASTGVGTTGECLVANTGAAPSWESCSSASAGGTAGGDLSGTYPNPKVVGFNGTPLIVSGLASSNILIYNGTDWVNESLSGPLTVSATGAVTIGTGVITNANLANSKVTINSNGSLSGTGDVSLGGSLTLSVAYGSTADTSVQGNTTLICPSGTGNLSGGGGTITLGTGGPCGNITITNTPSFTSLTLSTPLAVTSGGTGASTAANARSNLGAAASGANTDITSLGGLTTALPVNEGGTGATTGSGARTNLGAAASGANTDITSLGAATSVGSTSQALTLQGNASTILTATDSGFTTTVGFVAPTADVTYQFDATSTGTYDICTTAGNCVGTGGGVTAPGGGGTNGYIAMFTGSQTIANSILSQSGTTVTVGGTLSATDLQGSGADITNLNGTNISSGTVGVSVGGTGAGTFTQYGVLYGNGTGALQVTTAGSTGDCLVANTGSGPTWEACSTAAAGATPGGAAGGDLSGNYPNPEVVGIYNKPLSITSLASPDILIFNGTNWVNAAISGDITVSATGVATIGAGKVTNGDLAHSTVGVTAGNGLSGGNASLSLGDTTSLSVLYGSAANTAVEGNVTFTCPTNGTNITGGGTVITEGTGGACGNLSVVNNPSFSGLVTANGGLTVGTGYTFTNAGSTLNTAITITDLATGGTIGSAATTVDIATTVNVDQTTTNQALTIPAPTVTTAGRIIYVNDVGTASFTIGTTTIPAGESRSYEWNGTAWTILSTTIAGTGLTQSGNTINSTAATSVANDTNIQGSISGNILSLNWSGTLSVARGGTGAGTFTTDGILYGNGTGALQVTAAGSTGDCLVANTGGAPTWESCSSASGGSTPGGPAGGDLTGNYPNPTIAKLQGYTLTVTSPAAGDVLQYNGSAFVNGHITNTNLTAGTFSNITGTGALSAGSITTGFGSITTANNIQGGAVYAGGNGASIAYVYAQANTASGYDGVIVARGATSQAADLLQLQNSSGTVLSGFNANGQLYYKSGSYTVTLATAGQANNLTLSIPADANLNDTLCLVSLGNCTGANGGSGNGNYIENGLTTQTANFNIQSAAAGDVGAAIQGASSQTADLLDFKSSDGTILASVAEDGTITAPTVVSNFVATNTGSPSTIQFAAILNGGTTASINAEGDGVFSTLDSTSLTSSTGTPSFQALTVQLNNITNAYIQSDGGAALAYLGIGAAPSSTTALNVATAASADQGIVIQGASSQTADLLDLENSGGTVLAKVDANGDLTAVNGTFTGSVTTSSIGSTGNLSVQANGTGTLSLDTSGAGTVTVGGANASTILIGTNSESLGTGSASDITIGNNAANTVVGLLATGSGGTIAAATSGVGFALQGNTAGVRSITDDTEAFVVANSDADRILDVDTSGNTVTIGEASTITGILAFANAGNGNVVTLQTAQQPNAVSLTIPADTNTTDIVCLQNLNNCGSGGTGVATVGTLDTSGEDTSANGGTINGTVLYLQSATSSVPGLVNTSASGQTFGGPKTFAGAVTLQSGLAVSGGASITGTTSINTTGTASTTIGNTGSGSTVELQASTNYVQVTGTGIGINTATPVATLDVNGAISRGYSSSDRVYQNVFGYKDDGNPDTGTFVIVMPNGWDNTMMTATISGYEYASNKGAWQVVVSGYNYEVTPAWSDYSAQITGDAPFSSVRLGYDGTHMVIMLGTTTTTWHYPTINVDEFTASYSSVNNWGSGWSGSFVTNESAYSDIVTPTVNQTAYTDETFLQGGNSFAAEAVLGTNDNNSLALRTNGVNRIVLDTSGNLTFQQASTISAASAATGTQLTIQGGAATGAGNAGGTLLLQGGAGGSGGASGSVDVKSNGTNSTTAFQVQNAAGTSALTVDTSNLRVDVGTAGTPVGQLYVSGTVPVSTTGNYGTGTGTQAVYVQGNYAYVVNKTTGNLQIIDISTPSTPHLTGTFSTNLSTPNDVYVAGHYAYIASSGNNELVIVDVSNPAAPAYVGEVSTNLSNPYSVYVSGRYAYVASYGNSELVVDDVSNPASPVYAGEIGTDLNHPESVYVSGRYAYVASYGNSELVVDDISSPTVPAYVSELATNLSGPDSVYVSGRYAYITSYTNSELVVDDVSNPSSLSSVGYVSTGAGSNPDSVYVQGRYAYVATYGSSHFNIYDVSTPSAPASVGGLSSGTGATSVYVQGRYAYVTYFSSDLLTIYDLGGEYVQQLQAGGTETGTLQVDTNASIGADLNVSGGLTVGGSTDLQDGLSVSGTTTLTADNDLQNSPTAIVQNTGTGNATLALEGSGNQYYLGVDTANGGALSIGSAYAANGSGTNVGNTTAGSGADNAVNVMSGMPVITGGSAGPADSISIYIDSVDSGSPDGSVAIYTNNGGVPGTLVANSASQALTVGWNTLPITASLSASTSYWIVVNTAGAGTSYATAGGNEEHVRLDQTYGTWPAAPTGWGGYTDTNQPSMYLTYGPVTQTLGTMTIGSSSDALNGGLSALQTITTPSSSISATAISVYAAAVDATNPHAAVAVYTDNGGHPGTLVTSSASQVMTVGWNTLPITATLSPDTAYWLVASVEGSGTRLSNADGYGSYRIDSNPYDTWPTTYTPDDYQGLYTAYLTYASSSTINDYNNSLLTINATGQTTLKNALDSSTAFQIQDASGTSALTVDTSNMRLGVDVTYAAMSTPAGLTATAASGGGLTASDAYYYEVAAVDSAGGETTASTAACAVTTSSDKTINLSWTAVTGASGYKIYRVQSGTSCGTDPGTEVYLTSTLTNSYVDDGYAASPAGATTPPTTTTAYVSTNVSNNELQLSVGGLGTPTGQLYVSGTQPKLVSSTATNVGGSFNSYLTTVEGNYAYMTANQNQLMIYNVSNPSSPQLVSDYGGGGDLSGVYAEGNYLYGVSAYTSDSGSEGDFRVFDLSNPASPVQIADLQTTDNNPGSLYVSGHYAYVVGNTTGELYIYDVSAPSDPVVVGSVAIPNLGSYGSVQVVGRYAYVTNGDGSQLFVYDISDPHNPLQVGSLTFSAGVYSLSVQGTYAYLTSEYSGEIDVVDISDPAIPAQVGTVTDGDQGPTGIIAQGRYAYVVGDSNYLDTFDISNPISPSQISSVALSSNATGVDVQGRYAYVSDSTSDLDVYDLGGTYTQTLQAGSAEVSSLQVDQSSNVMGDESVQGGLSVVGNTELQGGLGVNGQTIINASSTFLFPSTPVLDNFNRANGSLGSNWTSSPIWGDPNNLVISSDAATSGGGSAGADQWLAPLSSPDAEAYVTLSTVNDATLQFFNNSSSNPNGYFLYYDASGTPSLSLHRDDSGTDTPLASVDLTLSAGDSIGMSRVGDQVNMWYEPSGGSWTLEGSATDATYDVDGYYIGLEDGVGGAVFDNFGGGDATQSTAGLTLNGTQLIQSDSTTAFQIQNTSGTSVLTADTINNQLTVSNLNVSGDFALEKGNDYSATGTTNNVDFGSGALFRLTGTSLQTITGIAGGTNGRMITLVNAATQAATLKNDDTADSSLANVIITGTGEDLSIAAGASVSLIYDSGSEVWRVVGTISGAESGGSYVTLQTTTPTTPDTGSFNVSGSGTIGGNLSVAGSTTLQDATDSPIAAQVDNAAGSAVLNVDTIDYGGAVGIDQLSAPTGVSVGSATAGGSLAASTTYYVEVTAVDIAGGESAVSSQVSGTTTSSNETLPISWTAVTGAVKYYVYFGTTSHAENRRIVSTTNSYNLNSTGGAATPTDSGAYSDILSSEGNFLTNTTVRTATDSTAGFQIQDASGASILTGDTTDDRIEIGTAGTPTGQLYVSGSVPSGILGYVGTDSGPSYVFTSGNYAYVTTDNDNTLDIFDISNPASPVSVSSTAVGSDDSQPSAVYVSGHYAYVTAWNDNLLYVYDVSNPASPVYVGSADTGIQPGSVYVSGHYAYVTNWNDGTLSIFDISNPADPINVSTTTTNAGGNPADVYVAGNYAYVTDQTSNTLDILNVSNPSAPTSVGSVGTGTDPAGIYVAGSYAYVAASGSNALDIFDISNPTDPTVADDYSLGAGSSPLAVSVQGRYAYVTNNGTGTVGIYDISNPSAPATVGTVSTGGSTYGPNSISVQGRYAYATDSNTNALVTIDLGGEYTQQLQAGSTETGTLQVDQSASIGGDLSVQGGLSVAQSANFQSTLSVAGALNVGSSLPSTPTGSVDMPTLSGSGTSDTGVTAGEYAYSIATDSDSNSYLQIYNLANPASPSVVSNTELGYQCTQINQVVGRYAYATCQDGVAIFDVSNPASPTLVGGMDITNLIIFKVSGNYLYALANYGTDYMVIYNVADPANPTQISATQVDTDDYTEDIAIQGTYAYLVSGDGILNVYNVGNPAAPTLVGSDNTGHQYFAITVQGNYAYAKQGNNGVEVDIFDISNPTNPVLLGNGSDNMNDNGRNDIRMVAQGGYVYIGDNWGWDLEVMDASDPANPVLVGTLDGASYSFLGVNGKYLYAFDFDTGQLQAFDLGGTYTQQLQAGGTETGTLQVDSNASVGGDESIAGSLTVGQGAAITGAVSITASSTSALQVQNAAGTSILNVDTTNSQLTVNGQTTVNASSGSFPTTSVLDNFNRANGSLGSNWAGPAFADASNLTIASDTVAASSAWSADAWVTPVESPDIEAYATVTTLPTTNNFVNLYIGSSPTAASYDGYSLNIENTSPTPTWYIERQDSGTGSQLGSITHTLSAGDSVGISRIGNQIMIWDKPAAGSWTLLKTVTDTTYNVTGYYVGLELSDTTARVDNFGGGASTVGSGLTVNGTELLQTTADSTSAFQVQNSSNSDLLQADTTNMSVGINGASTTAGYALNVTGSINASTSISVGGNVVCTAVGCEGIAASGSIATVGSLASSAGNDTTTLSVTPQNQGDLMVLAINVASGTIDASSVSGGDVTTWTKAKQYFDTTDGRDVEIWVGKITSTGSSTITVGYSGSVTSINTELAAQEYTAGLGTGTIWAVDSTGGQRNASSTTITYPSLTATTNELYVGYSDPQNNPTGGSTTGYTYTTAQGNEFIYNTSVTNVTSPTSTQSSAGWSATVGATIRVSSSSYINNSTTTQSGNVNVQAASSGSVAATLQANASGSGDILDLLNGGGTKVVSFGSTGNTLFQASTNAVNALQVANSSGLGLLNVDSTNSRVGTGQLAAPTGLSIGTATSGGSLAASTTYYVKVTAIDAAGGESAASSEASKATTSSNKTLPISWTAVTGAVSYRIYYGTTAGGEAHYYTSTTNSYSLAAAAGTAGTPPTVGSAYVNQLTGSASGTNYLTNTTVRTATNSTTAFQVQNAAGTSVLDVDTTNQRVGVGTSSPTAALTVKGSTSDNTTTALSVTNSSGTSLLNLADDGTIGIGTTLGSNVIGNISDDGSGHDGGMQNLMIANEFETGSSTANITYMEVETSAAAASPNNEYQVAIYTNAYNSGFGANAPSTLVASSAVGTLSSAAGWNKIAISATLSANTNYWLVYNFNSNNNNDGQPYYAGNCEASEAESYTFGSYPSSYGTPAWQYGSCYAMFAAGTPNGGAAISVNAVGEPELTDGNSFLQVGGGSIYLQDDAADDASFQLAGGGFNVYAYGGQLWGINNFNSSVNTALAVTEGASSYTGAALSVTGNSGNSNNLDLFDVYDDYNNNYNDFAIDYQGHVTARNGTDSQEAFQVQNAAGDSLLTVDTQDTQLNVAAVTDIGTLTNYAEFDANGQVTYHGLAQHQKTITLTPEYAGAVLDNGGAGNDIGNMTAGYDSTQKMNYYDWTTTQTSANTYDVVVTVGLPSDWSSWASSNNLTLQTWSDNTTNSTGTITVTTTGGSTDSGANGSSLTPGSASTWTTKDFTLAGSYTANGVMVIRIHMSANSSSNFRVGNLTLTYNSAF